MKQIEIAKRNRAIIQMAKDKKTAEQIAETFGMKRFRVLQILRAHEIKAVRVTHALESEKAKTIISMINEGLRQSDIARKLNVSRQYVSQIKLEWQKAKNN